MQWMPLAIAEPDLSFSLDLEAQAPSAARGRLASLDLGAPVLEESVMLLASELVARAVQWCRPASGPGVELRVWVRSRDVRVELLAPGKMLSLPLKREWPSYDMVLLRKLADRFSIDTARYPVRMWFEIDRPRAESPSSG
jgi:hypothetical protein